MRGGEKTTSGDSSEGKTPSTPDKVFEPTESFLGGIRKDDTSEGVSTTETLPKEKSKELGQKVNEIFINTLTDEDKRSAIAEAIEMKANREIHEKESKAKTQLGGLLVRAGYVLPIVGPIRKALLMNKYKAVATTGVQEKGLEGAFTSLGLERSDSKTINSENTEQRARQIIENGIIDKSSEGKTIYTSRLNRNETVEEIAMDKDARKIARDSLNTYYTNIQKIDEEATDKEELRKKCIEEFNDNLKKRLEEIPDLKDSEAIKEAIQQKRKYVDSLIKDEESNGNDIRNYIKKNITLYRTDTKENIYAKKEVDAIADAVAKTAMKEVGLGIGVGAGVGAVVLKTVLARGVRMSVRNAAKFMGASGGFAGAIAGGVTGYMRGLDKQEAKLSEHEIDAVKNFSSENESVAAPESTANTEYSKKAVAVVAELRKKFEKTKLGKIATGENILNELDDKRGRVNAAKLMAELQEKMASAKPGEENKALKELYAEIIARGKFSGEKQVDLIRYKDGDKEKLERLLNEANAVFDLDKDFNDDESFTKKHYDEFMDMLDRDNKEAEKWERKYKNRVVLVNTIQGAALGAVFGSIAGVVTGPKIMGALGNIFNPEDSVGDGPEGGLSTLGEKIEAFKGNGNPILIEDNISQDGLSIGFDTDGDGAIDGFLFDEGSEAGGIDLTDETQFEELKAELDQHGIAFERESITSGAYTEKTVGEYLASAENTVSNSAGTDWARSETLYHFGDVKPVVEDGMGKYEVPVLLNQNGELASDLSDEVKFYVDLDGSDGPGEPLRFDIKDGKAIVPADVLDTMHAGSNGSAGFIGEVYVGQMDGDTTIRYATDFGTHPDLNSTIYASSSQSGFAFTLTDKTNGDNLGQFAVDDNNVKLSNLSEVFNGIPGEHSNRFPINFTLSSEESMSLANGEEIPIIEYKGGYNPDYDSYLNKPYMKGETFLGTSLEWDADGDGQMSAIEERNYFRQLLVRTGTDPLVLGQNASNYGLLDHDRLTQIIDQDKLTEWGFSDGQIDNDAELNRLIEILKQKENSEYYDKLANATIKEMQTVHKGGHFYAETITDRVSTYTNSGHQFDTWRGNTPRIVIYGTDANKMPVGNKGQWCRNNGLEGQRVGTGPYCGAQAMGEEAVRPSGAPSSPTYTTTSTTTTTTPTTDDQPYNPLKPEPSPGPNPDPDPDPDSDPDPKDYDNMERIDNDIDKDREENVGTDDTEHHTDLETTEPTEKPSGSDYEGTEPSTVVNDDASSADPVQDDVSPGNDYSQNNGGVHDDAYSPNTDNSSGQSAANDTPALAPEPAPVEKETESFEEVMEEL